MLLADDTGTGAEGQHFKHKVEGYGMPDARSILNGHLEVSGFCAIEVMAGEATFTLSLLWAKVRAMAPWDLAYGSKFCVLKYGWILFALVRRSVLSFAHMGTPCQSVTCARYPPLRDAKRPEGLLVLSARQLDLVLTGNRLFAFSVLLAIELYVMGGYFVIENPDQSYLWLQPLIVLNCLSW